MKMGISARLLALIAAPTMLLLSYHSVAGQTVTHGTTYAVERNPKMIALAIDSSQGTIKSNGTSERIKQHCKIEESGGKVFVIAGVSSYKSNSPKQIPSFSVFRIVGDTLSRRDQSEDQIRDAIRPQLSKAFHPLLIGRLEGSSVVQIVIVDVTNGVPHLQGMDFTAHAGTLQMNEVRCPGNCSDGYEIVTPYSFTYPKTSVAITEVQDMVQEQINRQSKIPESYREFIGPVQSGTIALDGQFQWKQRPPFCPMIPSY
jgi:hypothetical protein